MAKCTTLVGILLLVSLPGLLFAENSSRQDFSIRVELNKFVKHGMTIDEAVSQSIKRQPEQANKIIANALMILKQLPRRACIDREGSLTPSSLHTDYAACADRIIRAAIMAGADPSTTLDPSAVGGANGPKSASDWNDYQDHDKGQADSYLRRILLLGAG